MVEKKKKVILSSRQKLLENNDFIERAEREGIELEKGAVITNEYLERHRAELEKWVNFFTVYPDIYLDIINIFIFNNIINKFKFLIIMGYEVHFKGMPN